MESAAVGGKKWTKVLLVGRLISPRPFDHVRARAYIMICQIKLKLVTANPNIYSPKVARYPPKSKETDKHGANYVTALAAMVALSLSLICIKTDLMVVI
jgi:hypothetical protein